MNIKTVISNGIAYAKVVKLHVHELNHDIYSSNDEEELLKYTNATENVLKELHDLKAELRDDETLIEVQCLYLTDPVLKKNIEQRIKEEHYTAYAAVDKEFSKYIDALKEARTTYLRERVYDMEDIKRRLLLETEGYENLKIEGEFILVSDTLYPSDLMKYDKQIVGVIAKSGGFTSHSAILCKAHEIPYVIVDDLKLIEGNILIDTRKNIINLKPTKDEIDEYHNLLKYKDSFEIDNFKDFGINIYANVTSNLDLDKVIKYNMDGVGLYRTEIIFMNLDHPMSYEEQYDIYETACDIMKHKSICFRTFDIGDDKQLPYIKTFHKGIDNYKNNPLIFETQIKALLSANKYNNMKIMFPMIETYEEYLYLKNWVLKIKDEMNNKSKVQIGMMLETKKALENIKEFENVDFMSLGTNDLTKELYNISREETLNYAGFIKDLLRKLKTVVEILNDKHITLSICGELASVKAVVNRLYRVGIRNFSVSTASAKALNEALMEELEE